MANILLGDLAGSGLVAVKDRDLEARLDAAAAMSVKKRWGNVFLFFGIDMAQDLAQESGSVEAAASRPKGKPTLAAAVHALAQFHQGMLMEELNAGMLHEGMLRPDSCLYGELVLDEQTYILADSEWYGIGDDFVATVNEYYLSTPAYDFPFPEFAGGTEANYSKAFVENRSDDFVFMDGKTVTYGGGSSSVEICDILRLAGSSGSGMDFIHLKKDTNGSASLSHLFNQAAVSSELLVSDSNFARLAGEAIGRESSGKAGAIERSQVCCVVGIITRKGGDLPDIPFFSKVSFRAMRQRMESLGVGVYVKRIANRSAAANKKSPGLGFAQA